MVVMCEFKVFLGGNKVFEDAVYCSVKDGELVLQDILGQSLELHGCHISEVDVASERLVLEPNEP